MHTNTIYCYDCGRPLTKGGAWEPMLKVVSDANSTACEVIHASVCEACITSAEANTVDETRFDYALI